MTDLASRKKGCWLTDHADIPVPPSRDDFAMTGNLQKRRGGFGKMSQQRWKNRCFVLLKTGNLCYFQAGSFDSVDFCDPPRGILTLDEDVMISKVMRPDGDYAGDMSLVIQGGGQRWKLSSEAPGEINRWEEALRSMVKGSTSVARPATSSLRSPTSFSGVKTIGNHIGHQSGAPQQAVTNGGGIYGASGTTFVRPRDQRPSASPPPLARATSTGVGAPGEDGRRVWDFFCALTMVDAVCYFLHKSEASFEVFCVAVCVVNLAVGWGMLSRAWSASRSGGRVGVPLIHRGDVGPLKAALKRRFPTKREMRPLSLGEVGEVAFEVPIASSTMQKHNGPPGELSAPHHSWSNGNCSVFRVRSKGYVQDKLKVVPAESLYEMVGMDVFATEARVGNMASEINLDSVAKNLPEVAVAGVPPLLVINVQLPSAPPALMSSAEDGPGYQCVMYFRLKESTARALKNLQTASEGVRLWVEYCRRVGIDEDFHGRFKCIANIANSESLGLPGFVTKYNGKPVLINKSGNWVQGDNYLENTINVHRFSFIAKKSLHSLKGMFKDMVLHVGFTIEGRSAEELPESLLACSTLHYPMLERAVEFDV